MEPIIDPWTFYLIGVLNKINSFVNGFSIILPFLYIFDLCGYFLFHGDSPEEKIIRKISKVAFIVITVLGVLSFLAYLFIPEKEVMYQMLAAKYATPDNIQAVQGNIVDFIGKVAEKLEQIK